MRTTDEYKGIVLKVRISEEMKARLDANAKKSQISVSEYVRALIEKDIKNNLKSNAKFF